MTNKQDLFRSFTTVNIIAFWVWIAFYSLDNEQTHLDLCDRIGDIQHVIDMADQGHDTTILNGCFTSPLTPMDKLQAMGLAY